MIQSNPNLESLHRLSCVVFRFHSRKQCHRARRFADRVEPRLGGGARAERRPVARPRRRCGAARFVKLFEFTADEARLLFSVSGTGSLIESNHASCDKSCDFFPGDKVGSTTVS